ncbi:MAG TPA: alpha/beta hydrolase [Candidatus Paceibacterota bacterium]|nr:alpha/beta hydrolase [Candidatus Paceibacterota bacterium]
MQDHYLKPRGIAYRTGNFETGRQTLVFIHGLSGNVCAWEPYEKALENSYNVLTYDLRGHGLSVRPKTFDEYDLAFFTEDLQALLEELQIQDPIIISHSFGTLVAQQFLLAYPNTAKAVLFISPVYNIRKLLLTRLTFVGLSLYVRVLRLFSPKPFVAHRHGYLFNAKAGDWDMDRVSEDLRTTGLRSYSYCLRHLYGADTDINWEMIATRAYILHGTRDSLVPVINAKSLAKVLPAAKLELLDDNHCIVLNNVQKVLDTIDNLTNP